MNEREFHVESVEGLAEVSDYLMSLRNEADVVAFYGPMGAGKTTLIKDLCHRMGVTDEVNSPTFAIVNEYVTEEGESVYHFDFYRIRKPEEIYELGIEDAYAEGITLIEWGEKMGYLEPVKRALLICMAMNGEERTFTLQASHPSWLDRMERL